MANIKAQLNNLRIAPRKTRAVVDMIKGKGVNEALDQLEIVIKRSSNPISKLIESAIANAETNYQMVRDNLYIKSFFVDEGVRLRRYMPRAMGRATKIDKKISHIRLVLDEKVPGIRKEKSKETTKPEIVNEVVPEESKMESKKPKVEKEIKTPKPGRLSSWGRKIFQRKAI